MNPSHHLGSDLLLAYAAGQLGEAMSVFVATHLAMCPSCRSQVHDAEAVGGAILEKEAPHNMGVGVLDSLLAKLDDDDREVVTPPSPSGSPAVIPEPLRSYTGPFGDIAWARRVPGICTFELPLKLGDLPVRLFKLASGMTVPAHSHQGQERGVVLTGGFTDDLGHFGRGDVSIRDPGFDHVAKIDRGEPCVVLFANDGLLRPGTLSGKLVSKWIKL